ncbi:hypothetical protein MRX96_038127 [Rhipicephalus microplus]
MPRYLVDSFLGFEPTLELELARQLEPVRGFEQARDTAVVLCVVSQRWLPSPLPLRIVASIGSGSGGRLRRHCCCCSLVFVTGLVV